MRNFKTFHKTTIGMKPQSETGGTTMAKAAGSMEHFKEFKKTTVGTKPQSETGGEKKAYDYGHEADGMHDYHESNSKAPLLDEKEEARKGRKGGAIFGGIMGGLGGAMLGHASSGGKGALIGGGIGALGGGLLGMGLGHLTGIQVAMAHKLGVEESQRIMAMPQDKRREYLKHLAHQNEIEEREAEEWSRHSSAEWAAERRHQEHMEALRG